MYNMSFKTYLLVSDSPLDLTLRVFPLPSPPPPHHHSSSTTTRHFLLSLAQATCDIFFQADNCYRKIKGDKK